MGEADLLQKPLFFRVFSVFGGLNRRFQAEVLLAGFRRRSEA
jgi:hypothetical protein